MSMLLECIDLHILQEAYYGKPKEFIEIEKRLAVIIDMIKKTKETPDLAVDINKMKELQEIEALFTKFFKNYKTSITFYAPILSPAYNAFTLPSSLSYFKKDPNNPRLTRASDLFINVNIDIGFVYGLEMTPQELMGIILHEIGHCFDASLFMLLTNVVITSAPLMTPLEASIIGTIENFLLKILPIGNFYQQVNRFLSQIPTINKFISDINIIVLDLSQFISILFFQLSNLKKININSLLLQAIQPYNIFGYSGEKFADSFATTYGYGKEVVTAMYKVQQKKGLFLNNNIAKIPILNIGYDLTKVSIRALTLVLDPHPSEATRIQSQLNKLKRDLNDPNLDPKVKKELLENIKDIENFIDNTVLNKDADENKGRWITMFANYIIIKVFNGKIDPRELFEAVWNHEM